MQMAMRGRTTSEVVEVEETTITRGGCRTKKDGDMVPHNGTKWIAVVPGGRMETVVIAEVNQEVDTEEAMMIEEVHLDRGDRSDSRNFSPQATQEDLEWKSGKCDVDLVKALNAMKESDLSKLTKLQTHELETWLSKVTRTMDGVHPMVSRYFRFVKKTAE